MTARVDRIVQAGFLMKNGRETSTIRHIRWWRRVTWGAFGALVPALVFAGSLVAAERAWWALLLPAALAVVFGIGWARLSAVRCPRCGHHYQVAERLLPSHGVWRLRTVSREPRACRECGERLP